MVGALSALAATIIWGVSDFSGGYATRRHNQYQVLVLASFSGLLILSLLTIIIDEKWLTPSDTIIAATAGIVGGFAIATFYKALTLGNTAFISPAASMIGASIPVVLQFLQKNPPTFIQLLGFSMAGLGIWLVSQSTPGTQRNTQEGYLLTFISGIGFGSFFVLIGQLQTSSIFVPLAISKLGSFILALLVLFIQKRSLPKFHNNPLAIFTGITDAVGNVSFFIAVQLTRLDVASVLASMYPATTVFLARFITKENVTKKQWLGVITCLAAIALIIT